MDFLKLIRWPNLLIVALTQFMVRFCLMDPMLHFVGLEASMPLSEFSLLVLSTVLIAAGGYIINDYYDEEADWINKPLNVIINKRISGNTAMVFYYLFNIGGILTGFFIGYLQGLYKLGFIHLLSAGLLYYYSIEFKKQALTGNIIIGLLSAMVPLIPGLYEPNKVYLSFNVIVGYGIFAFITTMIREIIKDAEDIEGDLLTGCSTLPIILGIKKTKYLIMSLILITITGLGLIQSKQINDDKLSFFYILIFIQFPLLLLSFKIMRAGQKSDYTFSSKLVKSIMVAGILFMAVFYYSLTSI